jgi:hypothetical protein
MDWILGGEKTSPKTLPLLLLSLAIGLGIMWVRIRY